MANISIRPGRSESMRPLRLVEHVPGSSKQEKSSEDHHIAEQMERIQMRISLPTHKGFPEMTSVVREQVDTWKSTAKPSGQQVDGQRETIHHGKERHDESRECAKGAPIAACTWMSETERKDDEHGRVHHYQQPEAISRYISI